MVRFGLVVVVGMLVSLLSVPASAQMPTAEIAYDPVELPDDPFEPFQPYDVTLTLRIACEAGVVSGVEPWQVTHRLEFDAEGITATWHPVEHIFTPDDAACASGEEVAVLQVNLSIAVGARGPAAGEAFTVTAHSVLDHNDANASAVVTLAPVPYFNWQARFEQSIWKTAPGSTVQIPLTVENLGNGPIAVTSQLADNTASALDTVLPGVFTVPRNGTVAVTIDATVPDTATYVNRRDTLIVNFDAAWSEDAMYKGDPEQLTAVIQTQGTAAGEAPGPGSPLMMVLAAAMLLFWLRRR